MEWLPIETAPKDKDILALGHYFYPDDKHPTIFYRVGSIENGKFVDEEGAHHISFFNHWMPLPPPPSIQLEDAKESE